MSAPQQGSEALLVRALTEPVLIMGIPREMTILNATLHIVFIQLTKSLLCALIAAVTYTAVHLVMKAAARKDPDFFQCFKRFIKHKKYYGI